MTAAGGVSVVIPTGGRERLHLLGATLASLRRCAGVAQIILSERGGEPFALDLARQWDADHVFTLASGAFDRAAALNAGSRLAYGDAILWCDGDLLFGPTFITRAREELESRALDYLAPFSRVEYLNPAQSEAVIAGRQAPADCTPMRMLGPLGLGAPGGMGLVRADFLTHHGGMVEFKGWGIEDDAWAHKVSIFGRIGATLRADQRTWHLFHADSGSHSVEAGIAARRRNANYGSNATIFMQMQAIRDSATWRMRFPSPKHAATPWPAGSRIAFAVANAEGRERAHRWSAHLAALYGIDVPVMAAREAPARETDALIGFCGSGAIPAAWQTRAAIIVADAKLPIVDIDAILLARTAAQVARLRDAGHPAWHRPWGENGHDDPFVLIQALSYRLASPRRWRVRIELDRALLASSALDRPLFWYVGVHDAGEVELLRQDLSGPELRRATNMPGQRIVIERELRSIHPPARWTVWPADRRGRWLDKLSGEIASDALSQGVRP